MEQRDTEAEKRYYEQQCVTVFLAWFNKTCGTEYFAERTEIAFPELTGQQRWDFVARQDGCPDWIALEVKEVTVGKYHTVPRFWDTVFEQVNRIIKGKLKGTFTMVGLPNLIIEQKKRKQLAEAISQVILDRRTDITSGGYVDIWPDIVKLLAHWPHEDLSGLTSLLSPGNLSPAKLYVHKTSDEGCHVGIAMYSSLPVTEAEDKQVAVDLLKPIDNRIREDSQLGVAKSRGAKLGIFLLDAVVWEYKDIKHIEQIMAALPSGLMSNTDAAYLVDVSHSQVTRVWPPKAKVSNNKPFRVI